jgi:hypothetical protein
MPFLSLRLIAIMLSGLTLAALFSVALPAASQVGGGIRLQASAANPDPGTAVTVSVITFAFDRSSADFRWFVNDRPQSAASGIGRHQLTLSSGREGDVQNVRVSITTATGDFRSGEIAIRTASAPLYWWTDTSVPYWYTGKALPSIGSTVHVIALPNAANPDTLSYRWEFNRTLVAESSGIGRRTYSFSPRLPIEERISVLMTDPQGTYTKTAGITIRPVEPTLGIYWSSPQKGSASQRVDGRMRAAAGVQYDFDAVPFFFPAERAGALVYTWLRNGAEIQDLAVPSRISLPADPYASSTEALIVRVQNPAKPARRLEAAFQVEFR